jgi:hypothetical protein
MGIVSEKFMKDVVPEAVLEKMAKTEEEVEERIG